MAGQAQEKAEQAAAQARGAIQTQVDERASRLGEQAGAAAGPLRRLIGQARGLVAALRAQMHRGASRLVDAAAEHRRGSAGYR